MTTDDAEKMRDALEAVINCDDDLGLTPYDYMHGEDDVAAMLDKVRAALDTDSE